VGAGLGHDRAFRASLSSAIRGHSFLRGTDRVSQPLVYLIWLLVVVALYPACRWFADVKRRRGDPWLGYL